ncbi:hypothetical protein A1O3_04337 [Capronia epimyces CBS 606.96]|uniref:Uncharacterized protein n=1 Tax=Capronia epimyces CBS 606.96 TaxID=1182542 RepID=W9Y4G4_9EURO|nr:uncharacterized protein A1O3_04337 [Capronia epimyces CBS 606.96]EXJ87378.1 hypothetical protein A1O3_04337 [Capronia epimyces CBS 606.96]
MREEFVINLTLNIGQLGLQADTGTGIGAFSGLTGFIAVATALGVTVENARDAVQVLTNTRERWLLVLDNADDPETDYQTLLPSGKDGTVIITSRMTDCQRYSTIGAVTVGCLTTEELTELLLKASGTYPSRSSSSSQDATRVISILESHTLAIIQAGAFIAAGHCKLVEFVKRFQQHPQQILRYRPRQAISRYGDIYATFEASIAILEKGERGTDASHLLDVLSMLHFSPVPIKIFEDAWNGAVQLQMSQTQKLQLGSTYLTGWQTQTLPLPEFVGPPGYKE